MKTIINILILSFLPYFVEAQTYYKMVGTVIEAHENTLNCNNDIKVVFGGKMDTVFFVFTSNIIVLTEIVRKTNADLEIIELLQKANKDGDKSKLYLDLHGNRYIVRIILVSNEGFIIFINNITERFPQYMLSFTPGKNRCR